MGITKLIQSEDVPLGLFFTMSRALGNRITINITNANAEIIFIQSIILRTFHNPIHSKQNPG